MSRAKGENSFLIVVGKKKKARRRTRSRYRKSWAASRSG